MDRHKHTSLAEPLTTRELDILGLIAEGLSDREIARELTLALETVKWYNKQIYSKLGARNRAGAVTQANSLGLLHAGALPDPANADASVPHTLPMPMTSFVGRRRELEEIDRLLANARLLTLTGLAGCGKTRLALQLAAQVTANFPQGVCFVPLAPVNAGGNILWAIAERVNFPFQPQGAPLEQLLAFFHRKSMLLVLDNFEHVISEAEALTAILQAAPQVKMLVTSRERLNLYGETQYVIGGLHLPDGETRADAPLAESVDLFVQRAQAVCPDFTPSDADFRAIARICQLVEGLPLGVELAATWVDILAPGEIVSEIQRSIDILKTEARGTPPRQMSVRAAFARSWDALDDAQRQAFRRLAVFRGGFTRQAARAVADIDLPTLQALVNKSLVRFHRGAQRYEMHELLRQYAQEQLEASGEASAMARSHGDYFARFMEERWSQMKGQRQRAALLEVEADLENARAAWNDWIQAGDVAQMARFFQSFWVIHDIRGWYPAGIDLFEQGIAMLREQATPEAEAALGWLRAAQGLFHVASGGHPREGFTLAREGTATLERLGRHEIMIVPLIGLFITALCVHETQVAVAAAQACLEIAERVHDSWGIAKAKQLLGMRYIEDGAYDQAERLGREALAIFTDSGDAWSSSILCIELMGVLTITQHRFAEAREWIERGLQAAEALDFKYSMQMAYWQLGYVAALQERYQEAGACWHKALGVGERVVGGKSIIGFGGGSGSGEWGGRKVI